MEIERKFLVKELPNLKGYDKTTIEQGYLSFNPEVRVRNRDKQYTLTVKGEGTLSRMEYETDISESTFLDLISKVQGTLIYKDRYLIPLEDGNVAELDVYKNINMITSTVEVEFKDYEASNNFKAPNWFGQEVTEDKNYKNKNLAKANL